MKKIVISGVIAGLLSMNPVFANEEVAKIEPGITPDSPLYGVDKAIENIKISLASEPDKEAELLLKIAKERLAEAQKMTDKEKIKYVNTLIDRYIESINKAEEKVSEIILDEEADEKTKDDLSEKLEDIVKIDENIKSVLDYEAIEKLENKKEEAYLVANVVKDLDIDKVKTLRKEGLGYGQISQVLILAEESDKQIEDIVTMFKEEKKSFGAIAKKLDVHPSIIQIKVIEKKQAKLGELLEKAKDNEDNKIAKKLEEKLKNIEERKKKQEDKIKEKMDGKDIDKNKNVFGAKYSNNGNIENKYKAARGRVNRFK